MKWSVSNLPWLPRAPVDFRARCEKIHGPDSGLRIRQLGSYYLDEKCSNVLARAIRRAVAAGAALNGLTPVRLALLSNSTTSLTAPAISAAGARYGLVIDVIETDFAQMFQETLDPASALYQAKPDIVLLAIDHRGLPLAPCLGDDATADRTVQEALSQTDRVALRDPGERWRHCDCANAGVAWFGSFRQL